MGVFSSGGVGIDLGSANVTICLENEGIVLREPSFVLTLREDTDEVLAVGRDADFPRDGWRSRQHRIGDDTAQTAV